MMTQKQSNPNNDSALRKQTEAALRVSEENFRRSLADSPLGIRIVNDNGKVLYANQAILDIYGYDSFEELIKTPRKNIYTPESYAAHLARKEKRQRGEYVPPNYQISIVRKDGDIRHLDVFRKEVLWNGEPQFQVLCNDITERKKAEEALRESEEKYRILYESSRDALMILEPPSWQFTSGNQAAVALFGARDEADFVSRGPWQYSPERQPDGRVSDEKSKEMIEKAIRKGSHFFEWIHRTLSGREFPASVLLTRMEINGQPLLQATVRDETEQNRAEEALKESEGRS